MYPRILVPIDGSDTANRALVEAIRVAHGHPGELVLLHVIDDASPVHAYAAGAGREQWQAAAEQLLDHGVRLATASHTRVTSQVCFAAEGTAADAIVEAAARLGCGLIVLGTRGTGVGLGRVAQALSVRSPVPLMLVPPLP